ncbi:hypothetical protein PGT21_008216 [Puccinia graminis f. sp. tritici]|uniref:Uncharacterized protein n=1 Tax=Puccinia graminis f. sp. tritici TaxID=56615 RepID=A0A5B0NXL9_PUCGR|nr:hypothetical protein PGT21_008216 [Puccinia graminis f. sp. tritici]
MSTLPYTNYVDSRNPPPGNTQRSGQLVELERADLGARVSSVDDRLTRVVHYCGSEFRKLTTSFGDLEKKVADLTRSFELRGSSGGVEANAAGLGAPAEDAFERQHLNQGAVPEVASIEVDAGEAAREIRKQEHIRLMALADKTIREARCTIVQAEKTISDVKASLAADFDRCERERGDREDRVQATRDAPLRRQREGSDDKPADHVVTEEGDMRFDYMNRRSIADSRDESAVRTQTHNTDPTPHGEVRMEGQVNGGSAEGQTFQNHKRQIGMLEAGTLPPIVYLATSELTARDEHSINLEHSMRASKRPRLN